MIEIPAGTIKTKWDVAVNELQPFDVKLEVVSNGTTQTIESQKIIDLLVTRTLYDKASIGNCASSQMDLSYKPNENVIGYWKPAYGDKVSIFISPKTLNGTWWCQQGVFYVTDVETDAYTNISKVKAADILTYNGGNTFPHIRQNAIVGFGQFYGASYDYDFEALSEQVLGVSIQYNIAPPTCRVGTFGVYVNGYSVRDVLSFFGACDALNYIITYDGRLRPTLFNEKKVPVLLGRRAENISLDGSWSDYLFTLNLAKQVEQVDESQYGSLVRFDLGTCEAKTNGQTEPIHFTPTVFSTGSTQNNGVAGNIAAIYNAEQVVYRKYNAFACTNIVFDPALELGDQVTVLNKSDSPLLAHDNDDPLLWIEPGNDDTRIAVDQPHAYVPYWEQQQTEDGVTGPIGKLVVDYKTPQIAQLLQSPAPQG